MCNLDEYDMIFNRLNSKFTGDISKNILTHEPLIFNCGTSNELTQLLDESMKVEFSGFETVLFNKQLTNLIHCPVTAKGSYIIPDTVETIGIEAFAKCKNVTSVRIPLSLKSIGCLAFESCISLTTILIPDSVIEMGFRIFSNCTGLTSIYVQAKSPMKLDIDSDIFYNVDTDNGILYVPQGTKKYYQHANQWRKFKNIVETESFQHLSTLN